VDPHCILQRIITLSIIRKIMTVNCQSNSSCVTSRQNTRDAASWRQTG